MSERTETSLRIGPFFVEIERRSSRMVFGRRRREGLRLSVERDGNLKVTAPQRTSLKIVEEFVLAHQTWIEAQREKIRIHLEENPPLLLQEGAKIRFFGEERTLVFAEPMASRPSIEVVDGFMVLAISIADRHPKKIQAALAKFFERQARLHLPERVERFALRMGVRPSGVSFRRQKTRWGSCSARGHISLNWKIVFASEDVIDYLVIHELAHLVHANHSEHFWSLVKTHDPDCQAHRRWLRDHQSESGFFDESY